MPCLQNTNIPWLSKPSSLNVVTMLVQIATPIIFITDNHLLVDTLKSTKSVTEKRLRMETTSVQELVQTDLETACNHNLIMSGKKLRKENPSLLLLMKRRCSTYLEADRGRRSAPEVHKVLAAVAQCLS